VLQIDLERLHQRAVARRAELNPFKSKQCFLTVLLVLGKRFLERRLWLLRENH
jgi:hypothetical protein